jgi:hypothetical protein
MTLPIRSDLVAPEDEDSKRGRRSSGSRTLSRGLALLNALGEHTDGATVSGLAEAPVSTGPCSTACSTR